MAHIQDRKLNFYSAVQSVRDESNAPSYLESAGDLLIRDLVKKQGSTSTTLEEQLSINQNFEKGTELKPTDQKGLTTLREFAKSIPEEEEEEKEGTTTLETDSRKDNKEENEDIEELKRRTGLSRHELELGLSEKPNSEISKLYKFALRNKRRKIEGEGNDLKSKFVSHPINHLKEIEEEYFGHLKTGNAKEDSFRSDLAGNLNESGNEVVISNGKTKKKKKKKQRKRKKGAGSVQSGDLNTNGDETKGDTIKITHGGETSIERSYRPSLWDVKDVRKLCESQIKGCAPQTFYTIKDGKIVKLDNLKSDVPET